MGGGPWGDWWAAGRRPRRSGSRQGLFPQGCAPHSLFGLAQKENAPRPVEEKKALGRAPVQWPSARDGGRRIGASADLSWPSGTLCSSAIFVTAVPWRMVRRASGWSSHCLCVYFRCRWPVVDGSRGSGPMRASAPTGMRKAFCPVWYKPLQLPGQRVAKRNARKKELVKCVLAARCCRHPRRGNLPSSLYRTPPRPSDSPRKPAGTISRRPPYSAEARRRRSATKGVLFFWTVHGPFSFRQDRKENGGCIAQLST